MNIHFNLGWTEPHLEEGRDVILAFLYHVWCKLIKCFQAVSKIILYHGMFLWGSCPCRNHHNKDIDPNLIAWYACNVYFVNFCVPHIGMVGIKQKVWHWQGGSKRTWGCNNAMTLLWPCTVYLMTSCFGGAIVWLKLFLPMLAVNHVDMTHTLSCPSVQIRSRHNLQSELTRGFLCAILIFLYLILVC